MRLFLLGQALLASLSFAGPLGDFGNLSREDLSFLTEVSNRDTQVQYMYENIETLYQTERSISEVIAVAHLFRSVPDRKSLFIVLEIREKLMSRLANADRLGRLIDIMLALVMKSGGELSARKLLNLQEYFFLPMAMSEELPQSVRVKASEAAAIIMLRCEGQSKSNKADIRKMQSLLVNKSLVIERDKVLPEVARNLRSGALFLERSISPEKGLFAELGRFREIGHRDPLSPKEIYMSERVAMALFARAEFLAGINRDEEGKLVSNFKDTPFFAAMKSNKLESKDGVRHLKFISQQVWALYNDKHRMSSRSFGQSAIMDVPEHKKKMMAALESFNATPDYTSRASRTQGFNVQSVRERTERPSTVKLSKEMEIIGEQLRGQSGRILRGGAKTRRLRR